jgi:hypothetical protein
MSSQEYAERLLQIEEARKQMERAERLADLARTQAIEDRDAEWAREDDRNQMNANIELLRVFAETGHLDAYNVDLDDLVKRIRGGSPAVTAEEQQAALPGGQTPQSPEPEVNHDH